MPDKPTFYGCTKCPPGQEGQIIARSGQLVCAKNSAHTWNDIQVFLDSKPQRKFTEAPPPVAVQANHVKLEVTVPPGVKNALESKYGARLRETVAQFLGMMAEGDVLAVSATDLDRIKQRFGKRPESSGELFGMLFAMGMQADENKSALDLAQQEIRAYENGGGQGRVMIDLGPQYQAAVEKARDNNEPLKWWLEKQIRTALESGWF